MKKFAGDGHYYSPLIDPDALTQPAERRRIWPTPHNGLPGIDFQEALQREMLKTQFQRYIGEYDYPDAVPPEDGHPHAFFGGNDMFGGLDARALFVIMRSLRPQRMIEVGCGWSTRLAADVNVRFLGARMDLTSVDPTAAPLDGCPGVTRILRRRVQDVAVDMFRDLGPGDILFIDSSHVVKTGSDVCHLYFEVLPRLRRGVWIHIHDVFLPEDYPEEWIRQGRSWSEQYLVRALLWESTSLRVRFGSAYAWLHMREELSEALRQPAMHGGSLWLERL